MSLHPSLLRSYSLYRQTLRVARSIKIQNTQQKYTRSRRISRKIPSNRIYNFVRTYLNEAFRTHKDNEVPLAVVDYHNEYRLKWILKGLEMLHKDATRKFFVRRALRLSPQLNILRQATFGYGNDVFRELLIRSFIVEAQNTPYHVLEKNVRLRKKASAQQERMAAKKSTERLGFMMRHITSDMSDEYIERTERSIREGEIDRLHREMLQEEIEEEEKLRDGRSSF